jgi:hypothetical protein
MALEGNAPQRFVIIAFDSVEKARGWYDSPAYQHLVPIRQKTATSTLFTPKATRDSSGLLCSGLGATRIDLQTGEIGMKKWEFLHNQAHKRSASASDPSGTLLRRRSPNPEERYIGASHPSARVGHNAGMVSAHDFKLALTRVIES